MIANLWMGFDDRAQSTANPSRNQDGDLVGGHESFRQLGDPSVRNIFRHDDPPGPRSYELWSLYYEVDSSQELLDIRNDLLADFPGQLRTIGAWEFDTGDQVFNPAGTQPLFPLHTSILEFIPDVDDIGTRPTVPSDVNLGLGQIPRQF